jgi:hypothetical protein
MTLVELYDQLDRHDWFHQMSDDKSVWKRGAAESARLVTEAAKLKGGAALLVAFQQHHFSGPPWNTERKPKPERPKA